MSTLASIVAPNFLGISTPVILYICVAVVFCSLLSGVFGSTGGAMLVGALLLVLDVSSAMILYTVAGVMSNFSRAFLWRRSINWRIVSRFLIGTVFAAAAMRLVAFVPNKAVVYLCLGATPFLLDWLPKRIVPSISTQRGPVVCGAFVIAIQLVSGASGGVLDTFFRKWEVARKDVVATKGTIQVFTQILRIAYFGSLSFSSAGVIPSWMFLIVIACSICGSCSAAFILNRMTDFGFRQWTKRIVSCTALTFIARGLWLFAAA